MHLALLVTRHDVGHRVFTLNRSDFVLQQCLTDTSYVTVTEDTESARD